MSYKRIAQILLDYGPARPVQDDHTLEEERLRELHNLYSRLWNTYLRLPLAPIHLVGAIMTKLMLDYTQLELECHQGRRRAEDLETTYKSYEDQVGHLLRLLRKYEKNPPPIEVMVNVLGLTAELFFLSRMSSLSIRHVFTEQPTLFELRVPS